MCALLKIIRWRAVFERTCLFYGYVAFVCSREGHLFSEGHCFKKLFILSDVMKEIKQ